MKKIVLTFGLIGGAISSGMMLVTLPFADAISSGGELLGYTTIVLSSLMIFFGVRSYRENVNDGRITFGRGLAVGLLIALISSLCYVVTWELVYFKLRPDFGDKVAAAMVEKVRASGADQAKIDEVARQAREFKEMYDKPLMNAAITFIEPFPVGLAIALISAAVLRKK